MFLGFLVWVIWMLGVILGCMISNLLLNGYMKVYMFLGEILIK